MWSFFWYKNRAKKWDSLNWVFAPCCPGFEMACHHVWRTGWIDSEGLECIGGVVLELQKDDNHCSYLSENIGLYLRDTLSHSPNSFIWKKKKRTRCCACQSTILTYAFSKRYLFYPASVMHMSWNVRSYVVGCILSVWFTVSLFSLENKLLLFFLPTLQNQYRMHPQSQGEEFTDRITHFSFDLNPLFLT